MKKFAIVMLVLLGCQEPFDLEEYIKITCDGTATREMLIHDQFLGIEMELIADALETANEDLGQNIQICGVATGTPAEARQQGSTIACDLDVSDSGSMVGRWQRDDVTIWVLKTGHWDHMRKVVLHELGHLIALDGQHSDDPDDIMCQGWHGVTEYTE